VNPITSMFTAAFSAVKEIFSWASGRSALKNAANVQAAAVAQNETNANSTTNTAIAKKDTNEIREEIAE